MTQAKGPEVLLIVYVPVLILEQKHPVVGFKLATITARHKRQLIDDLNIS